MILLMKGIHSTFTYQDINKIRKLYIKYTSNVKIRYTQVICLNLRLKWRVMVEKHTIFYLITQVRTFERGRIALSDKWAGSPESSARVDRACEFASV